VLERRNQSGGHGGSNKARISFALWPMSKSKEKRQRSLDKGTRTRAGRGKQEVVPNA